MKYETLLKELREKDSDSYEHSVRVGILAKLFCRCLGKTVEESEKACVAATLHDVGKIFTSDKVLKSTSYLSNEERAEMCLHALYGANALKWYGEDVYNAALYHHVWYSGNEKSYPQTKLTKSAIPEIARIVTICDTFDALSSKRCYKTSLSMKTVKSIMDEELKLGHYDPRLYAVFWRQAVPMVYGERATAAV